MWQKLKEGTGCYKVVWDKDKLNGLGDVAVERTNILNLFWEPGVGDIQHSRYLFHTELMDRDLLEEIYPQCRDKLKGDLFTAKHYSYDDSVRTDGKCTVVEVYYHVGRVLHYCKFVGDIVLYATENETEAPTRQVTQEGIDGPVTAEIATGRRWRRRSPRDARWRSGACTTTGNTRSCWTRCSRWRAPPADTATWTCAGPLRRRST